MAPTDTTNIQPKTYSRIVQLIAALTAIGLILPTTLFVYGYGLPFLEHLFIFDTAGLITKALLASSMIILVFFHRPRSPYLRLLIALFASAALIYANYGAFTSTLVAGDAVLYFIGSLLAMAETVEAKVPHRTHLPAHALHHTPSVRA